MESELRVFRRVAGNGVLRLPVEDVEHLPPEDLERLLAEELPQGSPTPLSLSGVPLPRVLAEGDSWFAYPRSWFLVGPSSNLILMLHDLGGFDITSLAGNGDEAVAMLAGESREELVERFAGAHYDVLLFSGGGNDVVGRYNIDYLVRRKDGGLAGLDLIHAGHFARRMEQVERAIRDLLGLVERFSKNPAMPVVLHTYDRPIPTGKGAKFVGGLVKVKAWIKPYLDALGVDDEEQRQIVAEMLRRYQVMLEALETEYPGRLKVVHTQGTLDPALDWKDEIHPTPAGFRKIALKIKAALDTLTG